VGEEIRGRTGFVCLKNLPPEYLYLVVETSGLKLSSTASMWVPSVNHFLHGFSPIIPVKERDCVNLIRFGWPVHLSRLSKATYQLLSVPTHAGQTPNNVFAK
jgi:hypothetical protein